MALNPEKSSLADELYQIGAIRFGAFELKLHEKNPNAPLSPIFLNFRTPQNPKPGPLNAGIINKIGSLFVPEVINFNFHRVVGVPRAGDPIAAVLVEKLGSKGVTQIWLNKSSNPQGRKIDAISGGIYYSGERVLVVDDLITVADSKVEAFHVLERAGLEVAYLMVIVDREQGGSEQLQRAGYNVGHLFSLKELVQYYLSRSLITASQAEQVNDYLKLC